MRHPIIPRRRRMSLTSKGVLAGIANRAMTLFTSLGPSADCRGLTQVPTYRERTGHARGAVFSVSQRGFSLGWGLQGKVARTPHQSKQIVRFLRVAEGKRE